jgi:hypothetical protein
MISLTTDLIYLRNNITNFDVIKLFIENNQNNIHNEDEEINTLLLLFCEDIINDKSNNNIFILEYLIQHIFTDKDEEQNLVNTCCLCLNFNALKLLLEYNYDVNIKDAYEQLIIAPNLLLSSTSSIQQFQNCINILKKYNYICPSDINEQIKKIIC